MGGTARPWQKVKSIRRRRRARAPSPLRNDQSDHSDQSDQSEQSILIRGERRQGCRRAAPALPTPSACGRPSVDRDARSSHAHQPGGSVTTPAVHSFFRGKRGLGRRARAPAPLAAPSTLLLAAVGPAARQSALYLSGTPGSGPAHIFARLAGPAGLIAPPVRVPSARSPRAAASGPPLCPPRASSASSPRPPGPAGLVALPITGSSHRLPDAPASSFLGLLAPPARVLPAWSFRPSRAQAIGIPMRPPRASSACRRCAEGGPGDDGGARARA